MEINIKGMCRGDAKASIAFTITDADEGDAMEFAVTAGPKEVPFQLYRAGGMFADKDDAYVVNVPLLKGAEYRLQAIQKNAAGKTTASAQEVIPGGVLKWRSRYAYRFQKELTDHIRDIDHSANANRTDFTITNSIYEPKEALDEGYLMLQGRIIPRCLESTFRVRCLDDAGNDLTHMVSVEETKNRKYTQRSSRALRRLVDYSISFTCTTKMIFLVVEETPKNPAEEAKPQMAIRAFDRDKLWEGMERNPATSQEMPTGDSYNDWFVGRHKRSEAELSFQRCADFPRKPLISILVPLYKTPEKFLFDLVESILNQSYANWELCLANASVDDAPLRSSLDRVAELGDARIKVIDLKENGGISQNTNAALACATGEFVTFVDHDDVIEPDALYEIVKAVNEDDAIDMLYSDEDHLVSDLGVYCAPNFKSDFNIDFLRSGNYITHLAVIRRSILQAVGGFDEEFDGAQDYDVFLKCSEKSRSIHHIARVLYHWREHEKSTAADITSKPYAVEAGRKALEAHLERVGLAATVENGRQPCSYRVSYKVQGAPKVSVVVANQSGSSEAHTWINDLISHRSMENCEILFATTGSEEIETSAQVDFRVVHGEQSLPARLNAAAAKATGEYLFFLDAGMVPMSDDFLQGLIGICQREDVGAVGGKSYYPDTTIEHAGVALSAECLTMRMFQGLARFNPGYQMRAIACNDMAAVWSGCLMTPRKLFQECGGFSEEYSRYLFDVEYCLEIGSRGLSVVFDPHAEFVHHCVKNPGYSVEETTKRQLDQSVFRGKWAKTIASGDRYLNPNVNQCQPYWNLP